VSRAINRTLRAEMIGRSWHAGCPVPISDLRLLQLSYVGFDHVRHKGSLIVNVIVADDVLRVFERLYEIGYAIRRMQPVDAFDGSDFASIEADNTSAFNCRPATGSNRWSMHAYGEAIDLNPIENPYVSDGQTSHSASVAYLDRSRPRPGMIEPGDQVVRAFRSIGWRWGGNWTGAVQDLQHFSINGS
jgi:hypothetical protein